MQQFPLLGDASRAYLQGQPTPEDRIAVEPMEAVMFGPIRKARKAWTRFVSFDPENAYLNEAMDRIDLERRQREIDAGKFRRAPSYY